MSLDSFWQGDSSTMSFDAIFVMSEVLPLVVLLYLSDVTTEFHMCKNLWLAYVFQFAVLVNKSKLFCTLNNRFNIFETIYQTVCITE